ncbi:MAG: nuclear transport factor 2 family protein [Rhodospirillaceae bacterium]|nr:nuclear transport factor 2 family protein [Rhodospirillaceae bacterium]MBT7265783.1 nuclear transport factor 2 family protein [Rhodospirillaceae bacterium]
MVNKDIIERMEVRELIEKWVMYRDSADWENFRTVWTDDGRMMATWFHGPAEDFIKVSIEGFEKGIYILHFLGGSMIDIQGDRAVAQTKMTISQRGKVHGVECDIVCTGRFYDLIERRNDKWGVVLRQPIYERDRMTPLDTSQAVSLDPKILARYPEGYQHLAYFQQGLGYDVKRDMPGLTGGKVEELYAQGAAWLRGEPDSWER